MESKPVTETAPAETASLETALKYVGKDVSKQRSHRIQPAEKQVEAVAQHFLIVPFAAVLCLELEDL